ncbi:hypothetical protein DU500_00450 [Haloplanus rubicundus]|uniref:Uncharacterized protein n=1 Tax=Haloplanus rubicundus TaxID=1547898 RepID=A0A345DYJ7_9EURY|nr:aldehyde ferredoxin oxidoreductase C-terminal domain-containing protein [Haloplanus rubicundus]AXG05019.1 hypothetical protein DU500_00450 [Haloplanus rubicundus]AXG11490.1 hypothetical protein DU484_17410 [Haloplanus rubicundus]
MRRVHGPLLSIDLDERAWRIERDDDALPYALDGLEAALDAYYEYRGWNGDGTVPAARCARLVGRG